MELSQYMRRLTTPSLLKTMVPTKSKRPVVLLGVWKRRPALHHDWAWQHGCWLDVEEEEYSVDETSL